ncbi:hypothetical protein GGR53DRAFT_499746 [Hypoxylon sp. FL1150]|nr:hypothetical protein GGR53DRAFT_499746 [Hypoxylon sp. FL1150]
MYTICAVITIQIGIAGYVLLPGTPDVPNRLFLSEHELSGRKVQLAKYSYVSGSALLLFAFITTVSSVAISIVLYVWVNNQLRSPPAKRFYTR